MPPVTLLVSDPGGAVARFARPADAVSAALDAARADLSARMALDTPRRNGGGPDGELDPAVARCLRLCAVANPGQLVMSHATRDLVADRLPEGVGLADLGVHRLPDLGRPEHVYALTHPDLPGPVRPLRSLDALPNNLPGELTRFVGREVELAELREALAGTRLLTLVGTGGCGKTRLALQTAADLVDRHPGGTWRVELAPVRDPTLVGDAVAAPLDARPLPGETMLDAATRHLAPRRALVLLDNCEHLLDAAAETASALLERCPEATVLVTSRAPLGLPGETVWRVPPMSLPDPDAAPLASVLADCDAVRLFVDRARRLVPGFAVTDASAPALAQACRELDGMPLAIELAAARVRMMSVEAIAAGLSDRFRLLSGAPRGGPPRHRSLRASVDWSHDMLSGGERAVLRRLAVFAGPFTTEAAEAVAAMDGPREAVAGLLATLAEKSLVAVDPQDGGVRYRLLETVRDYATERLDDAGEADAVRDRHLDYFLRLAETAAPDLPAAGPARERLERLDAEAANLRAALGRAIEAGGERALRMCVALTPLWKARGSLAFGEAACARALAAGEPQPSSLRARVLWARGYLLSFAGRGAEAIPLLEEAVGLAEEIGDDVTAGRAVGVLGSIRHNWDPLGARPLEQRARELGRASGDDWCFVAATQALAWSHVILDRYDDADRLLAEARPVAEAIGYDEGLAWICATGAHRHLVGADGERLADLVERAVVAARRVGEPVSEGVAHMQLARLELAQGRVEEAHRRIAASHARLIATGGGMALPQTDTVLAAVEAAVGDLDGACKRATRVVESKADHGWSLAWATLQLAEVLRAAGDADGAADRARGALEIGERIGSVTCVAWAKELLGRDAVRRGDRAEGRRLLHESLAARVGRGLRLWLPQTLDALAELAAGLGAHEDAARLLGAAERTRSDLGLVRWAPHVPALEALERDLRAALGDGPFEAARGGGARLPLGEAVEWASGSDGWRRRAPSGWDGLTPTEVEVARRVAAGLTNAEVAAALFVSPATVKTHLRHAYAKLGIRNRTELAAEAARRLSPETG
ncbi:MAG TPA: LuxR C-terminal-related transcriptional regulator [Thermoleophilaceae bacterium]|jgi:predicted ATPase/DNA-binding CsgD family transcriptional regulator